MNDSGNISVKITQDERGTHYFKVVGSVKTSSGCRFAYEQEITPSAYARLYSLLYPQETEIMLPQISKTQAGQIRK